MFFCGRQETSDCEDLMSSFSQICSKLGVPVADKKRPSYKHGIFRFVNRYSRNVCKIPTDKLKKLLEEINIMMFSKKVTLKQLQSLCGLLSFCTRALPSGRAFSRRLMSAMSKVKKPFPFN